MMTTRIQDGAMLIREITQVRTTHFLGLPSTAVWTHFFHVQNNAMLKTDGARKLAGKIDDWACG